VNVAVLVSIFDAEEEITTMFLGKQVVVQCRAHTAHVERAGGAGSKPYSYFGHNHFSFKIK
jgi:hypothetical protein